MKLPLWIVVPTKNEAKTLGEVVDGCKVHSQKILVLDGNSHDDSAQIGRDHGAEVHAHPGRGKGAAIRYAQTLVPEESVVLFIDADGSHDPGDIPRIVEPILAGSADHVTGSRLTGGSDELHGSFNEFLRLMGSSFITACINWRYHALLSDSQNGFRALHGRIFKKLKLRSNSTAIEQEMIMQTLKKGFRMAEVPAHESRRRFGKSNIKLSRDFLKYGYCLLKGLL